ncbi:MAG: glycosyltransferase family 4 protein [Planctomycetota bacterium]
MKVLMLGWEFPPRISGGLGTACHGLAHGLTRSGVDVLFVLPRATGEEDPAAARVVDSGDLPGAGEPPAAAGGAVLELLALDSPLRPYMGRRAYARRLRKIDEARGERAPAAGDPYGLDLLDEVDRFARAVAGFAGRIPFDVIHAHDWMTWPAGLAARRAAEKPLVCHVHSSEHERAGERADPRIAALEAEALAAADRTVCVSHRTAETVAARYGVNRARLRVVHNAAPAPPLAARRGTAASAEAPVVLFLGRLTAQKGPGFFLNAAAAVAREHPGARFVVSGAGDLEEELAAQAARLGLSPRLRFTGFLEAGEVERMYDLADVLVMPSVSEPFGLVPLEALSRGVPVIVTRGSGVTEVLASRLVVDHGDVPSLAGKILAVLRHPALRRQLVEEGRRELRRLRWERAARAMLDVYEELVE